MNLKTKLYIYNSPKTFNLSQEKFRAFVPLYMKAAHTNIEDVIVDKFLKYPEIHAIYCDVIINVPIAYYGQKPHYNNLILSPIFVNGPSIKLPEDIPTCCVHYFLLKNSKTNKIIHHIPSPLFRCDDEQQIQITNEELLLCQKHLDT